MSQPKGRDSLSDMAQQWLGDQPVLVVDGGARNKTWEIEPLAPVCHVFAFEPNATELDKIHRDCTDLDRFQGPKRFPYRRIEYRGEALGGSCGRAELHITEGPGACSLREPDLELIQRLEHLIPTQRFAPQFTIVDRQDVELLTLDALVAELHLDCVDYLKLDTQGTELECLEGAAGLLQDHRIGVIKTEVAFLPLYRGQSLFAETDTYLRARGFVLLDLRFADDHRVVWSSPRLRNDSGSVLYGDAYYALSWEICRRLAPERVRRNALIAGALGYPGFGLALLRESAALPPDQIERFTRWAEEDRRDWRRKMKDGSKQFLRRVSRLVGA